MTQTAWVLSALQQGPLTPLDALHCGGIFRLAARIKELRDAGYDITTQTHKVKNNKTVAKYFLQPQQKATA